MPLINQQYRCYKRDESYLLIFPEIPYWLVTKKGGYRLVQLLTEYEKIVDICSILRREFGGESNPENAVLGLYNQLKDYENSSRPSPASSGKVAIAEIVLSKKCNLNCSACYRNCSIANTTVLKKEEIEKFLKAVKHIGSDTCEIGFVGGEPLLHWDLLISSIHTAKKEGFKNFYMDSNATLITEEKAKTLYELGLKEVTVLLDGVSEDVHSITRDSNSFLSIKQGIKVFKDSGITVTVRMNVHRGNEMQMKQFIQYCIDEEVYPSLNPVAPLGRAQSHANTPLKDIFLTLKSMVTEGTISQNQVIRTIYHFFSNSVANLSCRKNCGIGIKSVLLNEDGDIYPCIESLCSSGFAIGSIKENTLSDIWQGSETKRMLTDLDSATFTKCGNCDLKLICAGHCRALTFHSSKRLDAPFIWCKDLHDTYIEAIWSVAETKGI